MTNHDDAGQPITDDELAEVVRLDATRTVDHGKLGTEAFERLQRLGLTLLPRLAREEMARRSEQQRAAKYAAKWKWAAKRLRFVLQGAEKDIAYLRRGARAMMDVLTPEKDNDWKPSSLAAALVVWADYVREIMARDDETQVALTTARAAVDTLVTWLRAGGYIPTDESDPIYVHVRDVRHALGGPPLTELEARAWTVQNGWTDPDGRHAPIVNALLLSNRGAIPVEVRDPRSEKP